MSFSETIESIKYKNIVLWQALDALAENDEYIKNSLINYRRPGLTFVDVSTVDIENNTPVSNETKVIFPDMDIRSVNEVTDDTDLYRRFIITETAEFTTGTENSGLRSGLSEASNTWYAIYAVKSQIDPTKFVLVGDTTYPTVANVSTLNSRYGENGWVYVGMIRNGDNDAAGSDILEFIQFNNRMRFVNSFDVVSVGDKTGVQLVAANPAEWQYSSGSTGTNIPEHLEIGEAAYYVEDDEGFGIRDYSETYYHEVRRPAFSSNNWINGFFFNFALRDGIKVNNAGVISLTGYIDNVLGVGFNPVI